MWGVVMAARNSRKKKVVAVTKAEDVKQLRPLLSDPIALLVRGYSEEWGIPAQAVVNAVLAEYFRNLKE